jgi:hypothetical protein
MLRLLRLLFTGSFHMLKWEAVLTGNLVNPESKTPTGKYYTCRCSVCGHMKEYRF